MENLDKLVDAISNEKPVDAEAIFKDEMKSRLTDAIKNKKIEIAKSLFAIKKDQSELDKIINPEE